MWPEVRKGTGRGKDRFRIRDHFADERCSQALLHFLSTADVGGGCDWMGWREMPGVRRKSESGESGK
jgi:hypothetical protein